MFCSVTTDEKLISRGSSVEDQCFLLSRIPALQGKTRLLKKVWRTGRFAVKYHWLFAWDTGVNGSKCISIQISITAIILSQIFMKSKADHRKVNFEIQNLTWAVHILSNMLQKRMKSTDFLDPWVSVRLLSTGNIFALIFQSWFTAVQTLTH